MTIDWSSFTPWHALLGGILIGVAVVIMLLANGRIAGISGIAASLLRRPTKDSLWQLAFIVGLLAAPWLYRLVAKLPEAVMQTQGWGISIAALLVGFGTRLGSGCTSGHGICGLSRFSLRSLIATLSFMLAGFITVYIIRHMMVG